MKNETPETKSWDDGTGGPGKDAQHGPPATAGGAGPGAAWPGAAEEIPRPVLQRASTVGTPRCRTNSGGSGGTGILRQLLVLPALVPQLSLENSFTSGGSFGPGPEDESSAFVRFKNNCATLMAMGFDREVVEDALFRTDNQGVDHAVDFLLSDGRAFPGDPEQGRDTPRTTNKYHHELSRIMPNQHLTRQQITDHPLPSTRP